MIETIKDNWHRYLMSSIQTFLAVFLPLVIPELLAMDWMNMEGAAVAGLVVAAARVGIKAVWEYWYMNN